MARLLLAHARPDGVSARRLAEALRRAGHHPWFAEDTMRAGEPLSETLARGLQETDSAVVCLSRSSIESGWTEFELGLVRQHAPARLSLYPVRLEPVPLPESCTGFSSIDLFQGEAGWRSGVERLVRALESRDAPEAGASRPVPPRDHLPPRARPFVGREPELAWLRERLDPRTKGDPPRRAVVWGEAGEGKTKLAREYAEGQAASYPGGLWWVHAEEGPVRAFLQLLGVLRENAPPGLREAVSRIPKRARLEEAARAVFRALEAHPAPSLLILDGPREGWEQTWATWLPEGHVAILVNCQTPPSHGVEETNRWKLGPLAPEESRRWLELTEPAPRSAREAGSRWRVTQELLGGQALLVSVALRLASSPGRSWEELERRIAGYSAQSGTRARAVLDLAIAAWRPNELPRRLLEVASLFAADDAIPVEWVRGVGKRKEEQGVDEALRALESMALLERRGDAVFLHEVVRQRVRALAMPSHWEHRVEYGLLWVTNWLSKAQDTEPGGDALEAYRSHLEELLRLTEPFEHPSTAYAASFLANLLMQRGEYTEAVAYLEKALPIAERASGEHLPILNLIRSRLVIALYFLGRDATRALSLMERVVESSAAATPDDRADWLQLLANAQLSTGALADALSSIERAISIDETELDGRAEQFPTRLSTRADLVKLSGNIPRARALMEEALVIGEKVLAPKHPHLIRLMTDLAGLRHAQGDNAGALSLYERALLLEIERLGAAHPDIAQRWAQIADLAASLNDVGRAQALVAEVLKACESSWGASDPTWAKLLPVLATALQKLGDSKTARQLLERAISIDPGSALETVPLRAGAKLRLAQLCLDEGDLDESRRHMDEAESLIHELPEGHPTRGIWLAMSESPPSPEEAKPEVGADALERAMRLFHQAHVQDSAKRAALERALATAQEADDPSRGTRALFLLAELEGRRGAWEQARTNAQQGLQLALRTGTPALVAEGYRLLGDAALHGSFYEEARMSYEEAIRRQDELGDPARAARTRALLVTLLLQLGRVEDIHEHVTWMREHLSRPELSEEDRRDMREVLTLADRRLSPGERGATHRPS
ncbi:MAG TPA: tetratricopeptide repeat protein [Archangium sp.]|nr:tetratricopeptide repeat protein [Archangium sp.]